MPPYTFHPQLLLRLPLRPYTSYTRDLDHQLLQPPIRNALLLASPALYHTLRKAAFNSSRLNDKQKRTLHNYFNRLHYRCTPFGLFAGTAAARWSNNDTTRLLVDEAAGCLHLVPDFSLEKETFGMLEALVPDTLKTYYTNTTCSFYKREIRYLKSTGADNNVKAYELRSIASSSVLLKLLYFCRQPQPASAIREYLADLMQLPEAETESILSQLKEEQLLYCTFSPNVSGASFRERLQPYRYLQEQRLWEKLIPFEGAPASLQQSLHPSLEPDDEGMAMIKSYAHLELQLVPGDAELSPVFQAHILDGLSALSRLSIQPELPDLKAFREAFTSRFDQQSIPLLQALDPELGVGYAGLGYNSQGDTLLTDLRDAPGTDEAESLSWTAAHRLLFRKWQEQGQSAKGIVLDHQDLLQLPENGQGKKTPSSTPILFRLMGDMLYLEQAGGATATSLAGRFSLFQDTALQLCREAAQHEIRCNPQVLFAEICSIQDNHAANIERRRSFYEYELPVLTHSLLPADCQITPNDLWIRVIGDRILLFSARHGKEIIPRLSSAFNFQRSRLGLYRFLCDMQYQGLRMYAPFHLKDFFPGLAHYPRVSFHNTILQLASWHIDRKELNVVLSLKEEAPRLAAMRRWIAERNWPRHIALTEQDNQLVFDLEQDEAVLQLLDNIKEQEQIVFKEFPFSNAPSEVRNHKGESFQQQFFTALLHQEEVYDGAPQALCTPPAATSRQRKYIPGSRWLYLKIYCHASRADDLLLTQLEPLLKQHRKKTGIEKWFFLRYTDTGFHIRFRILLPADQQSVLMEAVHKRLSSWVASGHISKIQLDTYEQEWERYGRRAMEQVETCFYHGSEWALRLLREQRLAQKDSFFPAMMTIQAIFDAAAFRNEERAELMKQSYLSLHREHGLTKEDELVLADKFRKLRRDMDHGLQKWITSSPKPAVRRFQRSLSALLHASGDKKTERIITYVSDMIHVQLNRIFTSEPRKREMVICFLMWKWYHSAAKRNG